MNTATQPVQAASTSTIQRNYIHTSKAWYASSAMPDNLFDSINIQVIKSGTLLGEFSINWPRLTDGYKIDFFNDAFIAINKCADMLELFGEYNNRNLKANHICDLLKSLGFNDVTPRVSPYAGSAA